MGDAPPPLPPPEGEGHPVVTFRLRGGPFGSGIIVGLTDLSRMAMEPKEILERYNTIAVVGLSRDPSKSAHSVPRTLQAAGFRIIPVNPYADTLLGEKVYRRLADIPEPIEVVEVFRPSAEAAEVARQAVAVGAKALWLQLGLTSPEARAIAEGAGLEYVEDRCMAVERAIHRITKHPVAG